MFSIDIKNADIRRYKQTDLYYYKFKKPELFLANNACQELFI